MNFNDVSVIDVQDPYCKLTKSEYKLIYIFKIKISVNSNSKISILYIHILKICNFSLKI